MMMTMLMMEEDNQSDYEDTDADGEKMMKR